MNHSHEVEQLWLRLDLVGIVDLTLGDFVPGIHMVYGESISIYMPNFFFFFFYLISNTYFDWQIGILGLFIIFIMVNPKFQGQNFRVFRALTFVATGLSDFAPLIHGVKTFGISQMMKQSAMHY